MGAVGAAAPTGARQWGQDYVFAPTEICPWKIKFEDLFCLIENLAAMDRKTCQILRVKFSPLGLGWIPPALNSSDAYPNSGPMGPSPPPYEQNF